MIETDRLTIRRFTPPDDQDLYEYLSNPDVYLYEPGNPINREQAHELALQRSAGNDFWAVILKSENKLIGHLYFKKLEPEEQMTWELGYIFNPAYQGKGYASEAAGALVDYAFTHYHAHRVMARCNPENTASWKLLEKIGFNREAYFRSYHFFRKDEAGSPLWTDAYEYSRLETAGKRVKIVPHQDRWTAEFREIASAQRRGLGDLAIRIDHIGSTSVPGLAAKDVIDIQITVAALSEEVLSALLSLGYSQYESIRRDHRPAGAEGPDSDWEKWFFSPPAGQRRTNTHVRVEGRANQRYPLLFRDYLRAHPATAESYAELKRRLARHLADPAMYPDVKDPAVDLIYLPAEVWAAETHWQPGPPDA